jgi:hypothetical protein
MAIPISRVPDQADDEPTADGPFLWRVLYGLLLAVFASGLVTGTLALN